MSENFNIHSLHGAYFTATICFDKVVGRISVNEEGVAYLCQDEIAGSAKACRDFFGYSYGFYVGDMSAWELKLCGIFNLKILPSPIEYHVLFQEILEKRGPTWDVDGNYSVIPNEVLEKIMAFMGEIKDFEPKNLGNNQNQS